MLDIVVCDDNMKFVSDLSNLIERSIDQDKIQGRIVYKASSPKEVIGFIKRGGHANVYFLDINLKDQTDNGFTLAELIARESDDPYIVLVTIYSDYLEYTPKIKIYDFLLKKSLEYNTVSRCMRSIYRDYMNSGKNGLDSHREILINSAGRLYKITISDIIMIERKETKSIIHTMTSDISTFDNLDSLYSRISNRNFIKCDRSFIINKNRIIDIDLNGRVVHLEKGYQCRLSNNYKRRLKDIYDKINDTTNTI